MESDGFWDRNQRYSYLVARENARRILEDPDVLKIGLKHLEVFIRPDPHQAAGYRLWHALLALPAEEVAARLTERSERGDHARQTSPSFGGLNRELRTRLITEARQPLMRHSI